MSTHALNSVYKMYKRSKYIYYIIMTTENYHNFPKWPYKSDIPLSN